MSKRTFYLCLILFIAHFSQAQNQPLNNDFIIEQIEASFTQNSVSLHITPAQSGKTTLTINGEDIDIQALNGKVDLTPLLTEKGLYHLKWAVGKSNRHKLFHYSTKDNGQIRWRHIPLWLSIIPPMIAILMALSFKEVIISLFLGIWSGSFIAGGMQFSSPMYYIKSFLHVIDKYIIKALEDSGHLSVIIFSLMIGGMVAIISRNGGMAGVVKALSKYARSERSSQFITWLLGIAIFFDDYANTLIVGNTMRSVTDKFKISREKLAYIVDSTAAPVSAIAFITTWIGAELGYIDSGMQQLADFDMNMTPYAIFLSSLKYSFYPVLTLGFILIIIHSKKDFGPMLKAERRARLTGQVSPAATKSDDEPDMEDLSPIKGAPLKWYNAAIPVLTVILMTIYGLLNTGFEATASNLIGEGVNLASVSWGDIWTAMNDTSGDKTGFFMKIGTLIGNSDSYIALLWASLSGLLMAIILTMRMRIVSLIECMDIMVTGFKTMLPALIILTFAWALAVITGELQTAAFITSSLEGSVSPYAMPVLVFILAAVIAFSTGSSWSTMAILYPIGIPATWALCVQAGLDQAISLEILYNVIATILAASVLGDHCSPISDTTILSSLASDCNHIDHVRTQMPYALLVGLFSLMSGFISTFLGGGLLISFILIIISFALLYLIVNKFGKSNQV